MNLEKVQPSLKDVCDILKKDIMQSLNCHAVGTIRAFDSAKQTVSVSINYKKIYYVQNSDGSYTQKTKDYPLLIDVPLIVLQGGQTCLTFPIAVGDTCLVLFNDRDIDNWYTSGATSNAPDTQRLHSMSDGLALIGLRAATNPIAPYNTTHAMLQWKNGGKVGVSSSKVLIGNALAPTLNDLLQELILELRNVTLNSAAFATAMGQPAISAAYTAQD